MRPWWGLPVNSGRREPVVPRRLSVGARSVGSAPLKAVPPPYQAPYWRHRQRHWSCPAGPRALRCRWSGPLRCSRRRAKSALAPGTLVVWGMVQDPDPIHSHPCYRTEPPPRPNLPPRSSRDLVVGGRDYPRKNSRLLRHLLGRRAVALGGACHSNDRGGANPTHRVLAVGFFSLSSFLLARGELRRHDGGVRHAGLAHHRGGHPLLSLLQQPRRRP